VSKDEGWGGVELYGEKGQYSLVSNRVAEQVRSLQSQKGEDKENRKQREDMTERKEVETEDISVLCLTQFHSFFFLFFFLFF
jgi:ABC-type Na+ efflux pump permease subunit